ncbi:flagellar basal body rod protein FlgB [Bacillus timonensis]|nr:flagellar basal body rod protein FlgB [Bacillus timonensis]
MKLFSNTINNLENGLTYASLKQKVIANNIANVDTPNYKAKDVSFKAHFNAARENTMLAIKTDVRHLDFKYSEGGSNHSNFKIVTNRATAFNHNNNNVDIDKEMSSLAENQIYYNAVADRLSGKFNSLKSVIRGGK